MSERQAILSDGKSLHQITHSQSLHTTGIMSDAGHTPNSDTNSYSNSPAASAASPPSVQEQAASTAETARRRSRSKMLPCPHASLGYLTDSLHSSRTKPREAHRLVHHCTSQPTSHDVPLTECSRPLPMWRRPRKQAAHHPTTPKARPQARTG
jgi:hypothetical protein